ncbi:MAG: helix-turn-helix domain-containing protein [Acidobacteria bacterium]|nr:helix-turn-helix domain-containing protein [Acidobacteriota bacterium]
MLTTRQLADAIGVSESSVKRWIDDGRIGAIRTAGGHRRVRVEEAARYVREAGMAIERPESLGLPDLAAHARRKATDGEAGEMLYDYLTTGLAAEATGLLMARFLAGASVAQVVDGPLVQAMTKVGELWRSGPNGILLEHRATEVALRALVRLRALLRPPGEGLVSVGGAPAGDPYVLASMSAAAVLEDEGFRATNLGPETPLGTLGLSVEKLRPRLVWISVSVANDATGLRREVLGLADRVRALGGILVVGGAQVDRLLLPRKQALYVGGSMAELRAIAHGLKLPAGGTGG